MYDTKAKEAVKSLAAELGFDLVGVTSADPFYEAEEITLERVRDCLMDGLPWFHAARVKRGCRPQEILPGARSIIAVAMSYMAEAPPQIGESTPLQGKVARYAWGQDYHKVMERRLKLFVQRLSERLETAIAGQGVRGHRPHAGQGCSGAGRRRLVWEEHQHPHPQSRLLGIPGPGHHRLGAGA